MSDLDVRFMQEALIEAEKAYAIDEVPVGCVIVKAGEIIARGFNQRETTEHVFNHAEMMAIDQACRQLGTWRLEGCTLYVTLEPCVMCAGTMIQARLDRLVYGAAEPKSGAHKSIIDLFDHPYNHQVVVESGVLAKETGAILKRFFQDLRKRK
ncbi:MAG: tRNA adenosine(34) deaminase TadA [bacterium]